MNYKPLLYILLVFSLVSVANASNINHFVTACNGINNSATTVTPTAPSPNVVCADPTGGRLKFSTSPTLEESNANSKNFLFSSVGGLQITASDPTISCSKITNVKLCYLRDGANTVTPDSCFTGVDLNGDGNYTYVEAGSCTSPSWGNILTCTDVTSAESNYDCNAFKPVGFKARSFSYKNAIGSGVVTHDQLWFDITYEKSSTSALQESILNILIILYIVFVGFVGYMMITSSGFGIQTLITLAIMLVMIPLLSQLVRGLF